MCELKLVRSRGGSQAPWTLLEVSAGYKGVMGGFREQDQPKQERATKGHAF
jgi:hypothetical protein